jgi:hypothetical protein
LFAKKEFIEASRKFVCIRIETYENKESEAMVRKLLNGKFANTAFCVFDPQGKRQLSSAGRSPSQGLQTRGGRGRGRGGPSAKPGSGTAAEDDSHDNVIRQMQRIAGQFKSTGESEETALQDFNTFRQALNVASADQRLLMFVMRKPSQKFDQNCKPYSRIQKSSASSIWILQIQKRIKNGDKQLMDPRTNQDL